MASWPDGVIVQSPYLSAVVQHTTRLPRVCVLLLYVNREKKHRTNFFSGTQSDKVPSPALANLMTRNTILLFSSHLLSSPFCYLSFLVVTQIWGHIAGSPILSPLRLVTCMFYREKTSALYSLVGSHRIAPTHARRSQHSTRFHFFADIFTTSLRWGSNSRISTIVAKFEGNHQIIGLIVF